MRRSRGVLALVALLTLVVCGTAGAGTARAATAPVSYSFSASFGVPEPASQQGLAFSAGVHYVGFDLGGGTGRIVAYDGTGREVSRSGVLATGHTNEISVRTADGDLYVTNSSTSPPVVDVVDMRLSPPAVVRTIAVPSLTHGAVVGVDNGSDQLVMVTGPTGGPYSLVYLTPTGTVLRKVAIPDQGITQGLEVVSGQVLLYTSLSNPARNQISVFSSAGVLLRVLPVPVASEGEGLAVDAATGTVYVGATGPDRVLRMSPAFVPETTSTTRTLVLGAVADTMARQQAPTTPSGAATTLLTDTQETTGAATRATPYLRFTVPALAPGETVQSAVLSLKVSNGTSNGPQLWRTAPGWDEAGLTWSAGEPARVSSSAVGDFGSTATGRVSASVSGVTGAGDVSLQLYADSSDGMQFTSRDSTTATARPQLLLTVVTS